MAGPMPNNMPVNPDTTMITVKVAIDGTNRRFKLALRDLGAQIFPQKLRFLLAIPSDVDVVFERYSDSAATYVTLDSDNPAIYKQLYRAAKAKLKLRIKATVMPKMEDDSEAPRADYDPRMVDMTEVLTGRPRSNYLETVLAPQTTPPAPIPKPSLMDTSLPNVTTETLVAPAKHEELQTDARAEKQNSADVFHTTCGVFCIDCNNCGNSIPNHHYHCSICDDGDFDLCMGCVENGVSCGGDDHWLIKRTLQDGQVICSTTEILPVKKEKLEESTLEVKEPEVSAETTPIAVRDAVERTCNSCISEYPNSEFVSCADCDDFDLCRCCLLTGLHGHNPAHTFVPFDEASAQDNGGTMVAALCKSGRNVSHMAICDGCEKGIIGVRHKCLNCPDWDYCSDCIGGASVSHPDHRFVPLYEPLGVANTKPELHFGIYCDGPLCLSKARQSYIRGIRYKCSVCHDTDFCASCEASPLHKHEPTHPLIKFKTPVWHVTVETLSSNKSHGMKITRLGDRARRLPPAPASTPTRRTSVKTASTETLPVAKSTNAATQVQTMVDFKPVPATESTKPAELDARFVTDAVTDGTVLAPDTTLTQVWTMTNPGPEAWPAGCSVRYTGGDWMLNVDTKNPSSVCAIYKATESNVTDVPVQPGESFDFKITLKTPSKEGRIISYWRLKSANGTPFGHKLWCDISVRTPAPAEPEAKPAASYEAPSVKEEPEEKPAEIQQTSVMIFPQLEKESPSASIHEGANSKATDSTAEPAESVAPKSPMDDFLEDVESLDLDDEDETEDGFLTDEEYDILDASDEEFLGAAPKSNK